MAEMESENPLLTLPLLRGSAPLTLAGYRRWRGIIDNDGAIPARFKRLFVAAAACFKGYGELAQRELTAAKAAGLSAAEAGAAVAILASVRGEGAAMRYYELFRSIFAEAAEVAGADSPEPEVAPGDAQSNFLQYFGAMPPSLAKLLELCPEGADAYYLMREGTLARTALGTQIAELLLVTVIVADLNSWAAVHINGARKAGASERAVAEAIICAVPVTGLSGWVVGATAMDA